ncbi:hypothetical protein PFICI_13070 [Pestalotiopsis fici W106-1]|uniref:DUF1479 domain protein n=1 Tax=Pestalotiopsis fici (strain W106-1 / CGMCC3.15140) TaxID=1229662 RepID=W3WP43_PESFW|nr:uncharacterized protein PFICI_13070 [Pestalotiopsis fici W106-1]ETS74586.1 hypothetical protein PFICI_13070 [Pestalotiopsis fici W106-1]
MAVKITNWPLWNEFLDPPASVSEDTFTSSSKAKAEVIAQYGEAALRQGWLKVCKQLEVVTERLAKLGSDAIPVLGIEDFGPGGLSEERRSEVKSSGCCIVRGVLDREEATSMFENLKDFVVRNQGDIMGWPAESPIMFNLYNSPTQVAVRTHPNQILVQKSLNSLYHDASGTTSSQPLSYTDATRIRPPRQPFLTLGPHIDAGSLCRWADPRYRDVYAKILSGYPEQHDPYDLEVRKDANQFLFEAKAHSVVFRAFQGWTALTPTSPSVGSLLLYPEVSAVIAYVMLRPFFKPPAKEEDVMKAEEWTFDPDSSWFPGTIKEQSQRLSPSSHPHLRLKDCLTFIPEMQPGDTVWWHTDMCHAVDPDHFGDGDASVVYVAACPTTPTNQDYVKKQLEAALAGRCPPDCLNVTTDETKLKGYKGFDDVSEEGKAVLGFNLIQ